MGAAPGPPTMNVVQTDRSQSELLSENECLRLLAGATLGRIAAHIGV